MRQPLFFMHSPVQRRYGTEVARTMYGKEIYWRLMLGILGKRY